MAALFSLRSELYKRRPSRLPFTLPATGTAQGFGLGDIRNKLNKIERAKAEKAAGDAWLRRRGIDPNPGKGLPSNNYPKCACGLTVYETTIWHCGKHGPRCRVCMPWECARELFGTMVNAGMLFDAADHGETD